MYTPQDINDVYRIVLDSISIDLYETLSGPPPFKSTNHWNFFGQSAGLHASARQIMTLSPPLCDGFAFSTLKPTTPLFYIILRYLKKHNAYVTFWSP